MRVHRLYLLHLYISIEHINAGPKIGGLHEVTFSSNDHYLGIQHSLPEGHPGPPEVTKGWLSIFS